MKTPSISGLLRSSAAVSLVLGLGIAAPLPAQTDPPILPPPGGDAAEEPAAEADEDAGAEDEAEAEDNENEDPAPGTAGDRDPAVEEVEVEDLGVEEPAEAEPDAAPAAAAPAPEEVDAEDIGVEATEDAEPEADVPEALEPAPPEPEAEVDEPEAEEPEVDEPEAEEPEVDEPEVEDREADEPAVDEAEAEDLLDEAELAEAQRESIAAAVAARLAEEEAKPEAQRTDERRERERMLGSALAGAAIGALLPEIGARLVGQQGDRVILQQDDRLVVRSDETRRFLAAGGESVIEELADGRIRITTTYPGGTRIVTLRDASGELVRRVRILPNGDEIVLFDEADAARLGAADLPPIRRDQQRTYFLSEASAAEIEEALAARPLADIDRRYSIRQIREHEELRWLMPSLALDAVTFETGSAELGLDQVRALDEMGRALSGMIARDPDEVFLVEGHTDAVGPDIYNLALSDRRAETVATLLAELYDVPPENLVTQGFGEQDLKVPTMGPSRENRRVELRRITPLLR
jgi:outer membrane protein OmpA-like peptidoglycan-associated protein